MTSGLVCPTKLFGDQSRSLPERFQSWQEHVEQKAEEAKRSGGFDEESQYWLREKDKMRGMTPQAFGLVYDTVYVPAASTRQALTEFIDRYNVHVDERRRTIEMILPSGSSREELLREAHELSHSLHGQFVVEPRRFIELAAERDFRQTVLVDTSIRVAISDPQAQGQVARSRGDEVWSSVGMADAVVALVASFITTGKDLTAGDTVVVSEGALEFTSEGLVVDRSFSGTAPGKMRAARIAR